MSIPTHHSSRPPTTPLPHHPLARLQGAATADRCSPMHRLSVTNHRLLFQVLPKLPTLFQKFTEFTSKNKQTNKQMNRNMSNM
jgi:hypothetical protein